MGPRVYFSLLVFVFTVSGVARAEFRSAREALDAADAPPASEALAAVMKFPEAEVRGAALQVMQEYQGATQARFATADPSAPKSPRYSMQFAFVTLPRLEIAAQAFVAIELKRGGDARLIDLALNFFSDQVRVVASQTILERLRDASLSSFYENLPVAQKQGLIKPLLEASASRGSSFRNLLRFGSPGEVYLLVEGVYRNLFFSAAKENAATILASIVAGQEDWPTLWLQLHEGRRQMGARPMKALGALTIALNEPSTQVSARRSFVGLDEDAKQSFFEATLNHAQSSDLLLKLGSPDEVRTRLTNAQLFYYAAEDERNRLLAALDAPSVGADAPECQMQLEPAPKRWLPWLRF